MTRPADTLTHDEEPTLEDGAYGGPPVEPEAAETLPTKRARWTAEEDDIIRSRYAELGMAACAELLPGRTVAATAQRAGMLRSLKPRTGCSSHAAVIEEMVLAAIPVNVMADTLGLNPKSLHNYIYLHGLRVERELLEVDLAREIAEKHSAEDE